METGDDAQSVPGSLALKHLFLGGDLQAVEGHYRVQRRWITELTASVSPDGTAAAFVPDLPNCEAVCESAAWDRHELVIAGGRLNFGAGGCMGSAHSGEYRCHSRSSACPDSLWLSCQE